MQNNERRRRNEQNGAPNGARSPFADGMPIPDMGSPSIPTEGYNAYSHPVAEGEGLPLAGLGVDGFTGPGSLELDEVAAATATTPVPQE